MFKVISLSVLGLVGLFALGWVATGNDLAMLNFFGPKYQAAQRTIYQQSPSYLNGNRQNLLNMVAQYRMAQDPAAKDAVKSALRAEVNGLPADFEVPAEVKEVLNQP